MLSGQIDSVLKSQIQRIQKDRPLRLALLACCMAAFQILSPDLGLTMLGVLALGLDLLGIPIERRMIARRSYGRYLRYCGLQYVATSILVVFFSLRTSPVSPGQGMVAEAVLWILLMSCLVRRSGKVYLMVASCIPIGVGLIAIHVKWSLHAEERATQIVLILISLALFIYAVSLIWHSMLQATEQASDRLRADRAAAARARFFATVNHEIRTPLNGILGMAQIIQSDAKTTDQKERARSLTESTKILKELADDLLDHAKLSAGQFSIKPDNVDIRDLIDSAARIFRDMADEKGLTLTVEIKGDVPGVIYVDPVRLRQILCNLISNALKHTEIGGVTVRASAVNRAGSPWLELMVQDTGCGIPKDRTETIFAPFEQLDDSAARAGLGTGLGLSIARDLTAVMGGTIQVKSETDVGSSFSVVIPLPLDEPLPAAPPSEEGHSGLEGVRVMVVDDSRINRLVARTFVEREKAVVIEASDGVKALAMLRTETVDVILMDLNMPLMNGAEALRRIRSIYGDGAPPVVLLSASESASAHLFDATLPKPIEREALVRVLREVLSEDRLTLRDAS